MPPEDRRGLSSLFTVLGTLIPSLVFGVLLSVFGRALPARARWSAVLAFAVGAGLLAAFNVDVLVGALHDHFLGIAAVSGLLALAVAAAAHGLGHLGGPVGIVTAILLLLVVGVSSAGGAVTYEFEPGFYGAVSQLLPPGRRPHRGAQRRVLRFGGDGRAAPRPRRMGRRRTAFGLLGERLGPHVRRIDTMKGRQP